MKKLILETTAYKILEGDLRAGKLSHAYMLDFPDAKNLKNALVIFALKFFGTDADEAKGARIANGSFPDCKFYPRDDKKLSADVINEIIDDSAMRPVEGAKKLFIISGFDGASALLQNKLLKTLEEPLEGVYFLLGVTSVAPVLDTVRSRVKLLEIPPFTEAQVYGALERRRHDDMNAAAAKSSGGVLGAAENMVDGGWFLEVVSAANEICRTTRAGDIGDIVAKYGDTKYKNELLSEMQRLYFSALNGGENLKPALIYAVEKLNGAFGELKFNAVFSALLYDFLLAVVRENKKWQKLSE